MPDQISFHANVTLLIIVSGSGGANSIWMQKNSVMIEIQVRHCIAVLSEMARAAGVKVFETGGTNWRRVSLNVSVLMNVIGQAFDFMKKNVPGDEFSVHSPARALHQARESGLSVLSPDF
jgi:hypothetical protein